MSRQIRKTADPPTTESEEQRRRAEITANLQKQKEFEERAVKIVERLLEDDVSEEFLKDSAQLIMQNHYQDVTEERSIAHLCGYPLCGKSLRQVPKQKYHISTKHNKVYDITDRKKFCSNQCYQASNHFEQQISTTPLWLRDKEPPVQFNILPIEATSGKAGKEVVTNPTVHLRDELEALGLLDPDEEVAENTSKEGGNEEETKKTNQVSCDDDLDSDDDEGQDVQGQEVRGQGQGRHIRGQGQGDVEKGQGQTEADVKSESSEHVEDKMKRLMELIDKRDKMIENLKQGRANLEADSREVSGQNISRVSAARSKTVGKSDTGSLGKVTSESAQKDSSENSDAKCLQSNKESFVGKIATEAESESSENKKDSHNVENISINAQTSFASRVLENIKKASSQKGNLNSCDLESVNAKKGASDFGVGPKLFQEKKASGKINSFECIKNSLLAWRTQRTCEYLLAGRDPGFKKQEQLGKTMAAVYQRLDEEEALDAMETGESGADGDKKRLPEFQELQRETEEFDVKVREFYSGKMTYATEETGGVPSGGVIKGDLREHETVREPVLPLVDSQSQMTIRRKIVLDGIIRILPSVLQSLKLIPRDVTSHIRDLINTFQLSSHNIVFKPSEWTLLGIIILKLVPNVYSSAASGKS